MEASHLFVEMLGEGVDLVLVMIVVLPEFDLGQHLIGEGVGHDEGGVAGGAAQVYEAAFGQQDDVFAVDRVFIDLRLDADLGLAVVLIEPGHVDLVVEVTDVANDGLVFHQPEMVARHDIAVAGSGHHDVGLRHGVLHAQYLETVHRRLQRTDRVDLGDDHAAAGAAQRGGRTFTYVAITGHDGHFTGQHDIGGATDGVDQRFLTAVLVVEFRLGDRVVYVEGRHGQRALLHPLVEPVHAGGRFFADPTDARHQFRVAVEHDIGQVAPVIEDHVERLAAFEGEERLFDGPPELLFVHTLPGVDRHARGGDGGSGVILSRENIAGGPGNFGAQFDQGFDEYGCLDGHVEAAGDPGAFERFRRTIFFAQGHQSGHLGFRQFDFLAPPVGKGDIFYFVLDFLVGCLHEKGSL